MSVTWFFQFGAGRLAEHRRSDLAELADTAPRGAPWRRGSGRAASAAICSRFGSVVSPTSSMSRGGVAEVGGQPGAGNAFRRRDRRQAERDRRVEERRVEHDDPRRRARHLGLAHRVDDDVGLRHRGRRLGDGRRRDRGRCVGLDGLGRRRPPCRQARSPAASVAAVSVTAVAVPAVVSASSLPHAASSKPTPSVTTATRRIGRCGRVDGYGRVRSIRRT